MSEIADPQDLYVDPEEGGCSHCRDARTCKQCADEARELRHVRARASTLVTYSEQALYNLRALQGQMAELRRSDFYGEFYGDMDADDDAAAALADAQRTIRSFARIARERAARTRQDP